MDLVQHNLGGIIGSFQKRNLAATPKKDWITIIKRNYFKSCHKKELFAKTLREGAKKEVNDSSKNPKVPEVLNEIKYYIKLQASL